MDCNDQILNELQRYETLSKAEFIQLCKKVGIKLHYYAKLGTLLEVEFGQVNLGAERELEVIRIALDGEFDLKEHF